MPLAIIVSIGRCHDTRSTATVKGKDNFSIIKIKSNKVYLAVVRDVKQYSITFSCFELQREIGSEEKKLQINTINNILNKMPIISTCHKWFYIMQILDSIYFLLQTVVNLFMSI